MRVMGWVVLFGFAGIALAADQPQWGHAYTRNMVSIEKGLPDTLDPAAGKNIRWRVGIGNQSYATPIVAGGRVYIGTNNEVPRNANHTVDAGVLMCFSEKDGAFLWQLVCPKLEGDRYLDWPKTGWQSPPTVEGDKVYVVSNRAEVLCLDANGQANENDGPFMEEGKHMTPRFLGDEPVDKTDGDILWAFDMAKDAGIWPHDGAHSSIVIDGPLLYLNTGNGVDNTHKVIRKPDAPSLIVLEKATGRLVARDRSNIAPQTFHANWSCPSIGVVNGKRLMFLGGGDGIVYAFEMLERVPSAGEEPATLREVWRFKMDPAFKDDVHLYLNNRRTGPSNIKSMPVFHEGRVYVTAGGDIWWGKRQSWLKCIDPTKSGDVTETAGVWSYEMPAFCSATPAIADGLAYIGDGARTVHCIDIKTGEAVWTHKLAGEMWSSCLVADGKVYVGTRKGDFVILAAGREKTVLCEVELGAPIAGTAAVANGAIFVATMKELFAIGK